MKREVEITNGSGWNNYAALRHLHMPRGIKALMAANGVQRLVVEPYDCEHPLGIAARFYDRADERLFTLSFDQNASSAGVRQSVVELLTETIPAVCARRAKEIAADELAKAKAAGFATAAEHKAHLASERAAEQAERERARQEQAAADAAAAPAMFDRLVEALRQFPEATRLTRKGELIRDLSRNAVEKFGVSFRPGQVCEWLRQHGHRPSVDERGILFAAAKKAAETNPCVA